MENGNIGQYIKVRWLERNLSQTAFGHKIGKSAQVISNWERGCIKAVSVEELAKIARALDVDVRYFFPDSEYTMSKCIPILDKCLQHIVDIYPKLDEHTKDSIDAIIKADEWIYCDTF